MIPNSKTKTTFLSVIDDIKTLRKNGSTAESQSQPSILTCTDSFSGFKNPSWRAQVLQKINASTSFTASRESLLIKHGNIDQVLVSSLASLPALGFVYRNHKVYFNPRSILAGDVSSISVSRANNLAFSDLASKIYEQTTAFQGGTFVGELKEAIQMLRNPGRSLRSGVSQYLSSAVKHTKKVKKRRTANDIIADTYLEYTFGWKPLLNDVRQAMDIVNKIRLLPYEDVVLRSRGKDEIAGSSGISNAGGTQPLFNGRYYTSTLAEAQYITCIRLGPAQMSIPKQLGFSPIDWIPTAWNLLPWSFVVDYFSNVGDIITSIANCTVDRRWTVKTTRKRVRIDHIPSSISLYLHAPHKYAALNVTQPFLRQERVEVAREPYTGSIIPSLEFQLPGSSTKWINLSALASQLFSSKKRINQRFS